MKLTGNSEGSRLQITTSADRTRSSVEMQGSAEQHIFNLVLLTRDICKALDISPFVTAGSTVAYIARSGKSGSAGGVMLDLNASTRRDGST